jgi:transglutaminase-like putative cysteine protease
MRLSIEHRTSYRFTRPQERLVQMLRLTPENTHDQTVASWRIEVDRDARMRDGRDGFGNRVTMLYVDGPVEAITVAVSGEVLTSHSDGVVRGATETLPPPLYLRATAATPADAAIAGWAADRAEDDPLATLHRLNGGLHRRFPLDRSQPEPGLTAAAAWEREAATPRDLAQMFAVAARALGHPARYVTGYALVAGDHRPTPHGWAEAHVDGLGWIAFDPCTGMCPQEDYVRVAIGLDAAGASPVAGSRLGHGEEALDVDVSVLREE